MNLEKYFLYNRKGFYTKNKKLMLMTISKIKKRDGRVVDFDPEKITNAIFKAAQAVGGKDRTIAEKLSKQVVELLEKQLSPGEIPTVEQVQDLVEKVLVENGHYKTAKAYILYRQKRAEARRVKAILGIEDELKLPTNALLILAARYLRRDAAGKIIESTGQMFRRVARAIAEVEKKYGKSEEEVKKLEEDFYQMMTRLEFLPNSPTLMNAGIEDGLNLSACFVIPVEDSIESIFDAIKTMAIVQRSGGGTGFSFSRLRPKGDIVKSTTGTASGPISFMKIFNAATEEIKQGGCISVSSLVRTDKGLLPIGELLDCPPLKDNPTNCFVYDGEIFGHAFIASDNGESEVYRIKTDLGLELAATYNHFVASVNEEGRIVWKEVEKIRPGDWLVAVLGGHSSVPIKLPKLEKQHANATPLKIPEELNEDLALLLGLYMADGRISYGRIIFNVRKDRELQKLIESLMLKVFGLKISERRKNEECTGLVFCSRDLIRFLERLGVKKEGAKFAFIPPLIMRAKKEVAAAFLRGLFEGGGDIHTDGHPRLYSASKILVQQVQQLLLSLGIVSSWRKYEKRDKSSGKSTIYALEIVPEESIEKFEKEINFITKKKRKILEERAHKKKLECAGIIPIENELKSFHTYTGGCGKYYFTKVMDVSKDREYTMDIETTSGQFVANGLLVHNKRRGANMGMLRVDHPDILDFIVCKEQEGFLRNFNISVAITDEFMDAVKHDKDFNLINPRNKAVVKSLKARAIWNLIVTMAWKNGEPGVVFIDRINRHCNTTPKLGQIEATNPCGEQPLLPYESCNLGSINLSKMVREVDDKYEIDWEKLRSTVRLAVRFLDNVIDANKYPIKQIEEMTKGNRKIGLGVMGFADMLTLLRIPYNSEEALKTARSLMKFITEEARKMSVELGKEKGSFLNFKGSRWDELGYEAMRNATVTTIAPTGSISEIAGCSQGIEPLFAIGYIRNVAESLGTNLIVVNPYFERIAIEEGFYEEKMLKEVMSSTSIQHIKEIPEEIRRIFVTAHDISPEWHVRIQAAFQEFVDNSISKTINFPHDATPHDVEKAFMLAYELGCLGVTVYRHGSRKQEVLKPVGEGISTCEVCELS